MNQTDEPKKNRESSVRWQGRTIKQFGYALNLVLGLSIAGIGYETTLILNRKIECEGWQKYMLAISLLALVISAGVALWCVIARLRNFRLTAEIARKREDGASDVELMPLRAKSKDLGNFSWVLFWWQIGSFAFGVFALVVVVAGTISALM